MSRPCKCRKVCSMPRHSEFKPVGGNQAEPVILTVDEYESIRLIDKEGFSQEQCAAYMQIARTTAQQIYNSARSKIAAALVEGRALSIKGGNFRLCDGEEEQCDCGGCMKHRKRAEDMTHTCHAADTDCRQRECCKTPFLSSDTEKKQKAEQI